LWPALSAVRQESGGILKVAVAFDAIRHQLGLRQRRAVICRYEPDLVGVDHCRGANLDAKKVSVDAVTARKHYFNLRAELAIVLNEGLTILERLVAVYLAGEQAARRNRLAVARVDHAHLILGDED